MDPHYTLPLLETIVPRPHVKQFLERLKDYFTIVVFTAAGESHMRDVLDVIDPKRQYFHTSCLLFNNHCSGGYLDQVDGGGQFDGYKDLKRLCEMASKQHISRALAVDDKPRTGLTAPENLICIKSYNPHEENHLQDTALLGLLDILEKLARFEGDLRVGLAGITQSLGRW
jgi:TFIIF-interacting CTD phosphatase-like protein